MSNYSFDDALTRRERSRLMASMLAERSSGRGSSRAGLSVAALILFMSATAMVYLIKRNELPRVNGDILQTYEKHQKMLEDTKSNLRDLTEYIENQSQLVGSTNKLLIEMQQKRDALKPILETEVNAVNALFQAQDERLRNERRWETVFSFVFGVLSSIAGTILWDAVRKRYRAWKLAPPREGNRG